MTHPHLYNALRAISDAVRGTEDHATLVAVRMAVLNNRATEDELQTARELVEKYGEERIAYEISDAVTANITGEPESLLPDCSEPTGPANYDEQLLDAPQAFASVVGGILLAVLTATAFLAPVLLEAKDLKW
jgi:hypothetical protein